MFQRMKNGSNAFKSIYSSERQFAPAVVIEEEDEDTGEVYERVEKVAKVNKSRYLPGERLMLKLNKQKEKELLKHKQKKTANVDMISKSLQNVLNIF